MHRIRRIVQSFPILTTIQERPNKLLRLVRKLLIRVSIYLITLVSMSSSEKPDKHSDNPEESTRKITSLSSLQEKTPNKLNSHSRTVSRDWMNSFQLQLSKASTKISLNSLLSCLKMNKLPMRSRARPVDYQQTFKFTSLRMSTDTALYVPQTLVFSTTEKLQSKQLHANCQPLLSAAWPMQELTCSTYSTAMFLH